MRKACKACICLENTKQACRAAMSFSGSLRTPSVSIRHEKVWTPSIHVIRSPSTSSVSRLQHVGRRRWLDHRSSTRRRSLGTVEYPKGMFSHLRGRCPNRSPFMPVSSSFLIHFLTRQLSSGVNLKKKKKQLPSVVFRGSGCIGPSKRYVSCQADVSGIF